MATKKVNLVISLKDNVSAGLQKIGKGVKTLGSGFKALAKVGAVAFASIGVAAAAVGRTIKKSFEFETAKVQLKSLLGSTEEATKRFEELRDFAASTPFQLPGLLDASKKLTVFTEGALGSADSLRNIGDAAAAVGTNIEEVSFWVGRAYSMLKGGKPFGEAAMRLQEMGILTPKVRDEMEKMQKSGASFDDIWAKMNGEMDRFNGSMQELSQTGAGKWSTLMDNMGIAMAEFGDELLSVSKDGIDDLTQAIQKLVADGSIKRWASQTATAIEGIKKVIEPVFKIISDLVKKLNDMGRFIGAFTANLSSGMGWKDAVADATEYVDTINEQIKATEKLGKSQEEASEKKKKDDEHWEKLLAETRERDIQTGRTSGWEYGKSSTKKTAVATVAEKISAPSASVDVQPASQPQMNQATLDLFNQLSEGRSLEGATSALSEVMGAMEGESIKQVVVLLEDQNKILNERLGGVVAS